MLTIWCPKPGFDYTMTDLDAVIVACTTVQTPAANTDKAKIPSISSTSRSKNWACFTVW